MGWPLRILAICHLFSPNSTDRHPHALADFDDDPPAQSVPSEYTKWTIHSLRPLREYECRVVAFDQYGRMGPVRAESVARGRTRERAPEGKPEIKYVRVRESVSDVGKGRDRRGLIRHQQIFRTFRIGSKRDDPIALEIRNIFDPINTTLVRLWSLGH